MEFKLYIIKCRDMYVTRTRNPHTESHWTLTGHNYNALERPDRPNTDDMEYIAESLGVSVSDLAVYRRAITETPNE